jgi:hypothetical protein
MYPNNAGARDSLKVPLFLIFLFFGLYFLNLVFTFVVLPEVLATNKLYSQGINFIAGALMIIGAIKVLFPKKIVY